MRVAGVDEAGRGCLIGPLVIAGASFDPSNVLHLAELGVCDSKKLTKKKRQQLISEIEITAKGIVYFDLQPWSIDFVVNRNIKLKKLNYLEAMGMAKVIRDLVPDLVYVDASDVNAKRFEESIYRVLPKHIRVVAEHKADDNYLVVSAASILAKVRRDSIIEKLIKINGNMGSGYPSDKQTMIWLEKYFDENNTCPPFIRSSWQPVKRTLNKF
jgi:ribonuclease HII